MPAVDQPAKSRAFAIPSALMREASVVGLMSSISAAPPGLTEDAARIFKDFLN